MDEDVKELVETYMKMTPHNKISGLSNMRLMLATQEATRAELEARAAEAPEAHG